MSTAAGLNPSLEQSLILPHLFGVQVQHMSCRFVVSSKLNSTNHVWTFQNDFCLENTSDLQDCFMMFAVTVFFF